MKNRIVILSLCAACALALITGIHFSNNTPEKPEDGFTSASTTQSLEASHSEATPITVPTSAETTTDAAIPSTTVSASAQAKVTATASGNKEQESATAATSKGSYETRISSETALRIALDHAGVASSAIKDAETELDSKKDVLVYEISFEKGNYEYEYVINAQSGKIISSQKEAQKQSTNTTEKQNSSGAQITAEQATKIALKHAGVSSSEIRDKKAELDREKDVLVYEVSFEKGDIEYEYVINADSGEILHSMHEIKRQTTTTEKTVSSRDEITADQALNIALSNANIAPSAVRNKETKFLKKNGTLVYDVSFEKDNIEYEYIIDAQSGKILHKETETDR